MWTLLIAWNSNNQKKQRCNYKTHATNRNSIPSLWDTLTNMWDHMRKKIQRVSNQQTVLKHVDGHRVRSK
jgi:hypothetical protein